jgi:sarcosine oxidase subunit beta
MTGPNHYDVAVIGGGVSGCTAALHLAQGGMRVALIERGAICRQASGVNAGTLSIQVKEAALVPYAMRGNEMWRTTGQWLGREVGFEQRGGLTLAFNAADAAMLEARMKPRVEAGAPIEMVGANRARELEPALSDKPVAASFCPIDGLADTNQVGDAFRAGLLTAGVTIHEQTAVSGIEPAKGGYFVRWDAGGVRATRVVLAAGLWLKTVFAWFGYDIPVACRVNQVSVTERLPQGFRRIIGVANGMLSLKQSANGSVLIGGGWQGLGDMENGGTEVLTHNLVANLRLAKYAVPRMAGLRIVRTWLGVEGHSPEHIPTVGPMPGHPDIWALGLVRGGFTIGPYIATLMAEAMLGREPERPLFDPKHLLIDWVAENRPVAAA